MVLSVCALMTFPSRSVILPAIVILLVMTAGCASTSDNTPPAGTTPGGTGITPGSTAGSPSDLTNQYSPQAAVFRNGASYTPFSPGQPRIGLEKIGDGLSSPVMMAVPDDGSGRIFVVDQIGLVRIVTADGKLLDGAFLDLRDRMANLNTGYDERGLLSIAFHPDFRNNSRVFVYYSAPLRAGAPFGWSWHESPLGVPDRTR